MAILHGFSRTFAVIWQNFLACIDRVYCGNFFPPVVDTFSSFFSLHKTSVVNLPHFYSFPTILSHFYQQRHILLSFVFPTYAILSFTYFLPHIFPQNLLLFSVGILICGSWKKLVLSRKTDFPHFPPYLLLLILVMFVKLVMLVKVRQTDVPRF